MCRTTPPQDCRSRGDCGIACPPRVVGLSTASRLPQSRRLRPMPSKSTWQHGYPPQDCRSRGDCGTGQQERSRVGEDPPQDCRSRGDCGWSTLTRSPACNPASRLPQSRRLRPPGGNRSHIRAPAASRLPQSRRLRHQPASFPSTGVLNRLKIAAVAATAASATDTLLVASVPPQDCRSRGDCGQKMRPHYSRPANRLKIAAVAATAALPYAGHLHSLVSASRLPQSRRLRPATAPDRALSLPPPQDCRSRGDCGCLLRTSHE